MEWEKTNLVRCLLCFLLTFFLDYWLDGGLKDVADVYLLIMTCIFMKRFFHVCVKLVFIFSRTYGGTCFEIKAAILRFIPIVSQHQSTNKEPHYRGSTLILNPFKLMRIFNMCEKIVLILLLASSALVSAFPRNFLLW